MPGHSNTIESIADGPDGLAVSVVKRKSLPPWRKLDQSCRGSGASLHAALPQVAAKVERVASLPVMHPTERVPAAQKAVPKPKGRLRSAGAVSARVGARDVVVSV